MADYKRTGTELARRGDEAFLPMRQVMDRLFQESFLLPSFFNALGSSGWGGQMPTAGTNLWETNDSYIIQVAMPGMKPDSISCTVEQNVLTCSGESRLAAPEKANALWQSFGDQVNYRIQLPGEVNSGEAQASYVDGVLTITMPKAAHARTKSIKVVAK
jgi:HSP20 family protein